MKPPGEPWPADQLEQLGRCPICLEDGRELLYDGLWDNTFFVAPGRWTMWRCSRCCSAYLDPRPTPESISSAYQVYYTHEPVLEPKGPETFMQHVRAALGNGYRNRVYGTVYGPANALGYLIGRAYRPLAGPIDFQFRFLPKIVQEKAPQRVLDVGCGAGHFLMHAKRAGWEAYGLDFDAAAVEQARSQGVEVVLGGLDAVADKAEYFDAVTLNHVIEHLHDPVGALRTVYSILKPGGHLYLETPNIDALGRKKYGRSWRALEAPRHLVIFNVQGLRTVLQESGFTRIRYRRNKSALWGVGRLSARIEAGLDPHSEEGEGDEPGKLLRLRSVLSRKHAEFMALTAEKPK